MKTQAAQHFGNVRCKVQSIGQNKPENVVNRAAQTRHDCPFSLRNFIKQRASFLLFFYFRDGGRKVTGLTCEAFSL